jgi:hypothetical protein
VNRQTKTERESQKIDYDEHKNEILYVQVAKLKAEIDNQRHRKVNNKKQKEKTNYKERETEIWDRGSLDRISLDIRNQLIESF